MAKLSNKEASFVSEYLIDCNGAEAARRAGYSLNSARQQACRMLTKDYIQNAIAEAKAEASKRNETTVDLIDQMHKEAFEMGKETKQCGGMTTSAMNLAKLHGLIIEKKEHDHIVEVKIQEGDGSL